MLLRSTISVFQMSKLQTRAGTPAPQCGTGVLARQIAENGLEMATNGGPPNPKLRTPNFKPKREARSPQAQLAGLREQIE